MHGAVPIFIVSPLFGAQLPRFTPVSRQAGEITTKLIMKGVIAIAAVWAVSHALALADLRGRVRRR